MNADKTDGAERGVIVFGSPVAVGHVRPLMPLAKRLVDRGFTVIWAISGDDNEPASAWRKPLSELGVEFVDVDEAIGFPRGKSDELASMTIAAVFRRVTARANDVAPAAAAAIAAAIAERPVLACVYDYFALWFYVAMRRLGVDNIDVVVSAFPAILDGISPATYIDDAVYTRELHQLRASGFGSFSETPRFGIVPLDPLLRVLCFSSARLCPDVPAGVQLLGVQRDALPRIDAISSAPANHQDLVRRLELARASGSPVLLLSMGTVVTRLLVRMGGEKLAFLRRLYTTFSSVALREGATIVASTSECSAAELGVDESALGPAARDRVVAMPFVPQPLLFAHGLVDAMLMHGGANTFYEAIVSGIPLLISPGFGDQEFVALAAERLGVGVCVESIMIPSLTGARPISRVAEEVLPAMLAAGDNHWKTAARSLAAHIKAEDGLDAAESAVLTRR